MIEPYLYHTYLYNYYIAATIIIIVKAVSTVSN